MPDHRGEPGLEGGGEQQLTGLQTLGSQENCSSLTSGQTGPKVSGVLGVVGGAFARLLGAHSSFATKL